MNETTIRESELKPETWSDRAFRVVLVRREHPLHPFCVSFGSDAGDRWHSDQFATLEEACREFDSRCLAHGLPVDNRNWPH